MFDIIGDIHGQFEKLERLVLNLGYHFESGRHPSGRTLIFLGDLMDRGPNSRGVFDWIFPKWQMGDVIWVRGNHDDKFIRWLKGNPVQISHGLETTVAEFSDVIPERKEYLYSFLKEVPKHFEHIPERLDQETLLCVHASPEPPVMYGKRDKKTGERIEWWPEYDGRHGFVAFGHYGLYDPTIHEHYCCLDMMGDCTTGERPLVFCYAYVRMDDAIDRRAFQG